MSRRATLTLQVNSLRNDATMATVQVSVSHDGGITNQVLNAQATSGWVDLGTYSITVGTGQVKLGRSSPGTMRADAVRWEPVADEVPVSVPPVSGGG